MAKADKLDFYDDGALSSWGALTFCSCTDDQVEIEWQDGYWVCLSCSAWRRAGESGRRPPNLHIV